MRAAARTLLFDSIFEKNMYITIINLAVIKICYPKWLERRMFKELTYKNITVQNVANNCYNII